MNSHQRKKALEVTHAVAGISAAGALLQAFPGISRNRILSCEDNLSIGLIKEFTSVREWRSNRKKALKQFEHDHWFAWPAPTSFFKNQKRFTLAGWLEARAQWLRDASGTTRSTKIHFTNAQRKLLDPDELWIWSATSLQDQLFVIWFLRMMKVLNFPDSRIRIVSCIAPASVKDKFFSVGSYSGISLARRASTGTLTSATRSWADAAWNAINSTPSELERFVNTARMKPEVRRAFSAFLDRFPNIHTGLPSIEFDLLHAVDHFGPGLSTVVGESLKMKGIDHVHYFELIRRLQRMASRRYGPQLVKIKWNGGSPDESALNGRVHLTKAGIQVLDGKLNASKLRPRLDSVGAFAVDGNNGRVWARDGTKLKLISRQSLRPLGKPPVKRRPRNIDALLRRLDSMSWKEFDELLQARVGDRVSGATFRGSWCLITLKNSRSVNASVLLCEPWELKGDGQTIASSRTPWFEEDGSGHRAKKFVEQEKKLVSRLNGVELARITIDPDTSNLALVFANGLRLSTRFRGGGRESESNRDEERWSYRIYPEKVSISLKRGKFLIEP